MPKTFHGAGSLADELGNAQQDCDNNHHRRNHPEVLCERALYLFFEDQTNDSYRQRTNDYQPTEPGVVRDFRAAGDSQISARPEAPGGRR